MTVLLLVLLAAAATAVCVLRMRGDLRRYGNAIWLTIAALLVLAAVESLGVPGAGGLTAVTVAVVLLSPVLLLVLIVACLANGVIMLRREGASLANLLSLLVGVGLVALIVAAIVAVVAGSVWLLALALFGILAAGYFGFVFAALVLYAAVYARIIRGRLGRRPIRALIVLGAGLSDGEEMTPLLRGRVDEAIRLSRAVGRFQPTPPLVLSGGKGSDEQISEAEAMRRYAAGQGVPDDALVLEDRSTTTRENLRFSTQVLDRPADGELLIVTSGYHAFRAAVEARLAGVDAHALGARTAAYFWLSATLREFVAFLREHVVAHAVALLVVALPLPVALVVLAAVR